MDNNNMIRVGRYIQLGVTICLVVAGEALAAGAASNPKTEPAEGSVSSYFVKTAENTLVNPNITDIGFRRGQDGEAVVTLELSDGATTVNAKRQGKKLTVDFTNARLAESLARRMRVADFATPVQHIDAMPKNQGTHVVLEQRGKWQYSAHQQGHQFVLVVSPATDGMSGASASKAFTGKKLSLDFQSVDVRAILQVLADFSGFNIIASDAVKGNLTLRLKNVPWDQALDVILKTRDLRMDKQGNVIWVAPATDIAASERSRQDAEQDAINRSPLVTRSYVAKYQKVDDLKKMLIPDSTASGNADRDYFLSRRGSMTMDIRTNTLFLQDTEYHLAKIESLLKQIDVPLKQFLIEGRVVIAADNFSRELGAKFGFSKRSGTTGSTVTGISGTAADAHGIANATTTTSLPNSLNVNLPAVIGGVAAPSIGLSVLKTSSAALLTLELSAGELRNKTKTISAPRVITSNGQKATIDSGVEIPYQQASSSGATNVAFRKATLGLEVTPLINSDNRINLDLAVTKDSVGTMYAGVPSINTNKIKTQVLINSGETVVLGGVNEEQSANGVTQVPLLGDIPIVGNLFKKKSNLNNKSELLIFITPKLME